VIHLLTDPFHLGFMRRALIEVLLLSVVGAVTGVHVLLRRRAFLTDALQHSVFPGIAIAFIVGQSLLIGALVAALLTVVLLVGLSRRPGRDPDAVMALLISSLFALGVVVVSHRSGFQADLTALLFGRILDVDTRQILDTALAGILGLAVLAALHKELVLRAFDPTEAAALGYGVSALDVVLDVVIAVVVVIAVRALGTVLVIAFIVTPAAAARLVVDSVGRIMAVAVAMALLCGWIGLSVSYDASVHHDIRLAAGATVVATLTLAFCVMGAAGWLARRRTDVRRPPAVEPQPA
jgi:manganese/iron transport system permease protein